MTPVSNTNTSLLQVAQANNNITPPQTEEGKTLPATLKAEQNTVTLSEEGKALLSALQQIETESAQAAQKQSTKVESFTHGALGLDHPDKIKEKEDSSYSAGQYLKGALSVGAILLALA